MCGCNVVDLWRSFIVVNLQVNFDCRRKRRFAVFAPHDPKHFTVLPQALCIDEAENHRQDGELEQFKLESVPKLAGRQSAEPFYEANVLARVLFAEMVRIKRVLVVHVPQNLLGDLLYLPTGND